MNKHCKNKIQRNRDKLCVLDKNVNIQQLNRKKNIKILARSGIEPGTFLQPSSMRYHWITETTKRIDCCQAILLFQRNGPNSVFLLIETCMDNYMWQFVNLHKPTGGIMFYHK